MSKNKNENTFGGLLGAAAASGKRQRPAASGAPARSLPERQAAVVGKPVRLQATIDPEEAEILDRYVWAHRSTRREVIRTLLRLLDDEGVAAAVEERLQ